jgi:SAM-dependent MidA family methyltransferase
MLADLIRDRIRDEGPLAFDDYMRIALYGPDAGFFSTGPLRSATGGDFLTSPEVSPLFGETIARFVTAEMDRVGGGGCIVDVGAGSGSLLRPLMDAVGRPVSAWAVEVSAAARQAVLGRIPEATVVASLAEVPSPMRGVIVANELIDNLPAALAVRVDGGWEERRVGIVDGELALVATPARSEVAAWAGRYGREVSIGGTVEVQLEAQAWVSVALSSLEAGALLVFDYGNTSGGLASRREGGTLRTYRAHHLGPDPLAEPGATDITMDVDFSSLADAAGAMGASTELLRQDDFLVAWGLGERLAELRGRELELARSGDPIERLRVRSLVKDGEALIHPRGLGDFRALVARK